MLIWVILLFICTGLLIVNPSLREYLEHYSFRQAHLSDVPHIQARHQCRHHIPLQDLPN